MPLDDDNTLLKTVGDDKIKSLGCMHIQKSHMTTISFIK